MASVIKPGAKVSWLERVEGRDETRWGEVEKRNCPNPSDVAVSVTKPYTTLRAGKNVDIPTQQCIPLSELKGPQEIPFTLRRRTSNPAMECSKAEERVFPSLTFEGKHAAVFAPVHSRMAALGVLCPDRFFYMTRIKSTSGSEPPGQVALCDPSTQLLYFGEFAYGNEADLTALLPRLLDQIERDRPHRHRK